MITVRARIPQRVRMWRSSRASIPFATSNAPLVSFPRPVLVPVPVSSPAPTLIVSHRPRDLPSPGQHLRQVHSGRQRHLQALLHHHRCTFLKCLQIEEISTASSPSSPPSLVLLHRKAHVRVLRCERNEDRSARSAPRRLPRQSRSVGPLSPTLTRLRTSVDAPQVPAA